jgi:hypothetical protein
MRDFMYVAVSEEAWWEYAIANEIVRVVGDEMYFNEGFTADLIGPIDGDTRFHVNLRVLGDDVEREFIRSKRYRPRAKKKSSRAAGDIEWVPPEDVASPHRIWLGGMQYFTENIPTVPPVNLALPFISAITAKPGDLLACAPGMWSGFPDLVTYQWMADGVEINQAITPNHTVRLTDVGHFLTCVETAKNVAGETSASSNPIEVPNG